MTWNVFAILATGFMAGCLVTAWWMIAVLNYNKYGSAWDFTERGAARYWKQQAEAWKQAADERHSAAR